MEKKGIRSIQPLPKGSVTENKKNQDSSSKQWPRGGRRRESHGATVSKNDCYRKPTPQRNKTIDKRPRPRGNYYSGAPGGDEEAGLSKCDTEIGSVFNQGSKKQNYSHLLNFRYDSVDNNSRHWNVSSAKYGHRWNSNLKHKYNKEQFLQANCQFVVNESGDYKIYANNPDTLVDWNLIEQVNIHVSEFPSCPICLYPPVAAKMTRCGHIYCWSCMLYYVKISDDAKCSCPICYETIRKNDLRSVVAIPHQTFKVSEFITFKLMKRIRGSLIAYPCDYEIGQTVAAPLKVSDENAYSVYTKLLLANKSDIKSIVGRERRELLKLLDEDANCREKDSIEEALLLLLSREESLQVGLVEHAEENNANFSDECKDLESLSNATQNMDISVPLFHYYYQASDGQHIYLHPLNVRMLEHTYGMLENSPRAIQGRIIEKEPGSITDEVRKRYKYLQHLSITCPFEIAEIELLPSIIDRETVQYFQDEVEARRKRRQRKAREEKRREKRIAEEENRKLGKFEESNISLQSQSEFPDFLHELPRGNNFRLENFDGPALPTLSDDCVSGSDQADNGSNVGSLSSEDKYPGLSFAKMLSSNITPAKVWPSRKLPSTEPKNTLNKNIVVGENNGEEYPQDAPTTSQSIGDFITKAFQNVQGSTSGGGGKKKKKNKFKPFTE